MVWKITAKLIGDVTVSNNNSKYTEKPHEQTNESAFCIGRVLNLEDRAGIK